MKVAFSKLSNQDIVNCVIGFMIIATVIDMGGGLKIKYLSYIIALVTTLFLYSKNISKKSIYLFFFLYAFCPLLSFYIGMINNAELSSAIIQFTPFIPAIIILLLLNNRTGIHVALNSLIIGLLCIAVLTIVLYFYIVLFPSKIESLSGFMQAHNMGFFGNKDVEGSSFPGIYFKSVLFLNFGFVITLYFKMQWRALILFIGILLSFSKSATAIAIICWIIIVGGKWLYLKNGTIYIGLKKFLVFSIIILSVFSLIVYYANDIDMFFDYFINAFTGKSATATVRIKHFESVIALFEENPIYIITGQGIGTSFYTTGFGFVTDNIEIDHINTIRKFGFIWSTMFYSLIAWEIIKLYSSHIYENKALGLAFISTFILVGTNPLLINPLFLMLTVIIYKIITLKYHTKL